MQAQATSSGSQSEDRVQNLTPTLFKGKFGLTEAMFQEGFAKGEFRLGTNKGGQEVVWSFACDQILLVFLLMELFQMCSQSGCLLGRYLLVGYLIDVSLFHVLACLCTQVEALQFPLGFYCHQTLMSISIQHHISLHSDTMWVEAGVSLPMLCTTRRTILKSPRRGRQIWRRGTFNS